MATFFNQLARDCIGEIQKISVANKEHQEQKQVETSKIQNLLPTNPKQVLKAIPKGDNILINGTHQRQTLSSSSNSPRQINGNPQKLNKTTGPNPKRPLSGFRIFLSENNNEKNKTNNEAIKTNIAQLLLISWNNLPKGERMKYKEKADKLKQEKQIKLLQQIQKKKLTKREQMQDKIKQFKERQLKMQGEKPSKSISSSSATSSLSSGSSSSSDTSSSSESSSSDISSEDPLENPPNKTALIKPVISLDESSDSLGLNL